MRTTRFWNNLHQVRSKSNGWNPNIQMYSTFSHVIIFVVLVFRPIIYLYKRIDCIIWRHINTNRSTSDKILKSKRNLQFNTRCIIHISIYLIVTYVVLVVDLFQQALPNDRVLELRYPREVIKFPESCPKALCFTAQLAVQFYIAVKDTIITCRPTLNLDICKYVIVSFLEK